MSGPQVSVVIPTVDRPTMVLRAIETVRAQTMRDFEIIVVIDGGDPATIAALAEVDEPRLRVVVNADRQGAGGARDAGVDAATAEWIAFLDDDDEWLPEKLARQLALVRPGDKAIVTTLYRVVSAEGERIAPSRPYDGRWLLDEWLFDRHSWFGGHEAMLQTSALMMPRQLFGSLRFGDMRHHDEWELCLRAVKTLGFELLTVPEALVIYNVPQARASLSLSFAREGGIAWADGIATLLSRRAYSGYVLTVAMKTPSVRRPVAAFVDTLVAAARRGQPTARQLFAFALIALVPPGLRRRLRARHG